MIANVQLADIASYQATWVDKGETGWYFLAVYDPGDLPVAGVLALGVLAGVAAVGGALALRRKK